MNIGNRLLQLRIRCQLSQKKLAIKTGLTQQVISAYENGSRTPGLENLKKISDATGGSLNWLVAGSGKVFLNKEMMEV